MALVNRASFHRYGGVNLSIPAAPLLLIHNVGVVRKLVEVILQYPTLLEKIGD